MGKFTISRLPRNVRSLREIGLPIASSAGPQIVSAVRSQAGKREFVRLRGFSRSALVLQNPPLRNRIGAGSDTRFALKALGTSPAQEVGPNGPSGAICHRPVSGEDPEVPVLRPMPAQFLMVRPHKCTVTL